jgi:hypothetical protein
VGLWAGAAYAAGPVTATFSKAVETNDDVIVASTVWSCSGNSCVTRSAPDQVRGITGCKAMVAKFGPVTAYGAADNPLNADQLTRCNAQ